MRRNNSSEANVTSPYETDWDYGNWSDDPWYKEQKDQTGVEYQPQPKDFEGKPTHFPTETFEYNGIKISGDRVSKHYQGSDERRTLQGIVEATILSETYRE